MSDDEGQQKEKNDESQQASQRATGLCDLGGNGNRSSQLYTGAIGDQQCQRLSSCAQSHAVLFLSEGRQNCLVEDAARHRVRNDRFQSVTDFDPHLPVFNGSQQQCPVVFTGLPDSPAFEKAVGKIGDLPAVERRERDHGNLCSRLLFQLSE